MNERHCTPTSLAPTAWHAMAWALQRNEESAVVAQSDRTNTVDTRWDTGGDTVRGQWHNPTVLSLGLLLSPLLSLFAPEHHHIVSYRIASSGDATHRSLGGWCTRDKLKVCPGCAPPRVAQKSVVVVVFERRALAG